VGVFIVGKEKAPKKKMSKSFQKLFFGSLAAVVLGMVFMLNPLTRNLSFWDELFITLGVALILGIFLGLLLRIVRLLEEMKEGQRKETEDEKGPFNKGAPRSGGGSH